MKHDNPIGTLLDLANDHIFPIIERKAEKFDPNLIRTHNYEVQQEIEEKITSISDHKITLTTFKKIISELKTIDFNSYATETTNEIKKEREELAKVDNRAELLYQLIEEANKVAPLLPLLVINRRPFIFHLEEIIKPSSLLKECENLEGEPKAEKAADFYHDVAERAYDNYVRVLWELCCIIKGKKQIKSNDTFGGTIRNLKVHLPIKYHDLIDFDASWYRNTTAHKSRQYLPAKKVLLLYGKVGKEICEEEICADCLLSMAEDNYWMSGEVLFQVSMMYLRKDMHIDSGFIKINLNMLKCFDFDNPDKSNSNQHELELKNLFKHLEGYKIIRQ